MELEIKDVIHTYPNKKTALNRISLTLTPGIYGLLGPNGAGKSTLMKIITGNMQPSGGKVLFNGSDIKELGREYRDRLGYMPQQQGLYNQFTGRRFLWYMATLKGLSHREAKHKINDLLEQMNLTEVADRKISGYSGGMKQRLLIAQAVMNSPDILVLDEPTAGLDPKERINIRNFVSELSRECVVIFATHVVSDVECIAKEMILIKRGEIVRQDEIPKLIAEMDGLVWEFVAQENVNTKRISGKQFVSGQRRHYRSGSWNRRRNQKRKACSKGRHGRSIFVSHDIRSKKRKRQIMCHGGSYV